MAMQRHDQHNESVDYFEPTVLLKYPVLLKWSSDATITGLLRRFGDLTIFASAGTLSAKILPADFFSVLSASIALAVFSVTTCRALGFEILVMITSNIMAAAGNPISDNRSNF